MRKDSITFGMILALGALCLGGLDPAEHNQVFMSDDLRNWETVSPEGQFWGERMFFSSTVTDDDEDTTIRDGDNGVNAAAAAKVVVGRPKIMVYELAISPSDSTDNAIGLILHY